MVTSDRLVPCETPANSRLLAAALRVRPEARCFGSPTCSDWVFLRDRDAIKCGPGTSRNSHAPDEWVTVAEVSAARAFYARLAAGVPRVKRRRERSGRRRTASGADAQMLAYTVGDDRHWDTRLLPWDVLGSLGHVEGLRASGLISTADHRALRAGLRAGLKAARAASCASDPGRRTPTPRSRSG